MLTASAIGHRSGAYFERCVRRGAYLISIKPRRIKGFAHLSAGSRQSREPLPLQVEEAYLAVVVRDGDQAAAAHTHSVHRRVRPYGR